jgi:hypothetical protein
MSSFPINDYFQAFVQLIVLKFDDIHLMPIKTTKQKQEIKKKETKRQTETIPNL